MNAVSWFDAARVANWLHNGGGSGDTENGAYTLNGAYTGNAVARNPGAQYYIPTENQWYKAAYYKGGGQNAGYWSYGTQSNSVPSPVTATSVGVGQVGATSPVTSGNYANYDDAAVWNSAGGDETTVGTNGGPSAYGAFDMTGNVSEWNDFDGLTGDYYRGLRGGSSRNGSSIQASSFRERYASSGESLNLGFRLAAPVPEPSTYAMAFAGLACGGFSVWRRRRRACRSARRYKWPVCDCDVRAAITKGLGDGMWNGTVGITSSAAARDLARSGEVFQVHLRRQRTEPSPRGVAVANIGPSAEGASRRLVHRFATKSCSGSLARSCRPRSAPTHRP